MIVTVIVIALTVSILLANHVAFSYRLKKKKTDIRQRIAHGIGDFLIIIVSVNVCLAQFEFGRSVQDYMLKNAAFLVAIFSFSMQQVFRYLLLISAQPLRFGSVRTSFRNSSYSKRTKMRIDRGVC